MITLHRTKPEVDIVLFSFIGITFVFPVRFVRDGLMHTPKKTTLTLFMTSMLLI